MKMYTVFGILVSALLSVNFVEGGAVPINPCKADDSKCLKDNIVKAIPIFAKGIPEYNMPVLDPLFIKKVDASTSGLKFILTDVTIEGLSSCVPKKASRDLAKGKLVIKFLCNLKLEGQYELNGQLLVLPIEGKGPVHAFLRKVAISGELELKEITGKDGKTHWDISSNSHSFVLKDKSDLVFENLFSGNEVLGRAARELIASNSNDVVLEIGPPVVKAVFKDIVKAVQKFFDHNSVEEITLN